MNQKVFEGLAKILEDEKLNKEFSNAKTNREKYDIAKPYIGDASFEEFEDFANKIVSSKGKISLDDLENVSGGANVEQIMDTVVGIADFGINMYKMFKK